MITVHEIGVNGCTDPVRLELGAYEVRAMPIFVQGSQSAVGVAAAVLCGRGEFCCGCVPVTDRFKTAPTTEQAMNWMKSLSCSIVCAVPLVVSPSGLGEDFCSKLGDLFREFKLFGVITKVSDKFYLIR